MSRPILGWAVLHSDGRMLSNSGGQLLLFTKKEIAQNARGPMDAIIPVVRAMSDISADESKEIIPPDEN